MVATDQLAEDALVPPDIAQTVISPKSYTRDDVIFPALKWLRQNKPVGKARIPGYDDMWFVTKHADIMAVEKDQNLFHSGDQNPILNDQASDAFIKQLTGGSIRSLHSLTFMDPPEHWRNRSVAASVFLPAKVAELADRIRVIAKQSVEKFLSFDGEIDFVKDFALYYPLRVVMTQIGVPPEDEPKMLKLTQEFFGTQDPEEQRSDIAQDPLVIAKQWRATIQDFYDYFNALRADRRANPRDDLISVIGNAKVDGEYLSEDIANGFYVALAAAGHDTTSSTTSGAFDALLDFPDQFALLKKDASLIPTFVDEAIRWTCPVKHFMRSATADTEIRGQRIRKDDRIFLSYPSANRDEEVFDRPDVFDITRSPNKHIGFGFGPHVCLGQHLAKLEMKILFEELLPHISSIERNGEGKLLATNFVGGLKSLPIRFKKA